MGHCSLGFSIVLLAAVRNNLSSFHGKIHRNGFRSSPINFLLAPAATENTGPRAQPIEYHSAVKG